jgi:group I intron endonuclease
MGYIYLITNKIDGKKYIGQTVEKDVYERWRAHFKKRTNCRYLKHAFEKYGKENFKFEIICICFDKDCNTYENEYMKKYNTIVPNGYNLREAGNHGHQNEETKKKIGDSLRLHYSKLTDEQMETFRKIHRVKNTRNIGKKMSDEHKEKMSKCRKDKKKVNCYSLENEFIATHESLADAERKTGAAHGSISKCCRGKTKTVKGFIWKYAE